MNPIPLYYKSYEYKDLGIEAPFIGVKFELIDGEAEIVPGVRVYPTPGHSPDIRPLRSTPKTAPITASAMRFSCSTT